MSETNKFLTTTEVYEVTGVCPKIINKWIENGYIRTKGSNDRGRNLVSLLDVIKYNTSHPIQNRDVVWDRIIPQENEDFRLLHGYDDRYAVSKNRIVNFTSGDVLETNNPREDGYIVVYLQKDGVSVPKYAHCLTSEMFCPNKRRKMFPNVKWETHHIEIGFEHRKDINPDKLLPVTSDEHTELHRRWSQGKKKEYWQMIKRIKKLNKEEWFKIPHPDYEPNDNLIYFMYLTMKGYKAYKQGEEIPLDSIRCESAEAKETKK